MISLLVVQKRCLPSNPANNTRNIPETPMKSESTTNIPIGKKDKKCLGGPQGFNKGIFE